MDKVIITYGQGRYSYLRLKGLSYVSTVDMHSICIGFQKEWGCDLCDLFFKSAVSL